MTRPISRDMSHRLERLAAVIMFLVKAPRTCKELVHLLGMPHDTSSKTYINRFLQALEEEGLIEMSPDLQQHPPGQKGRPARVWTWVANREIEVLTNG